MQPHSVGWWRSLSCLQRATEKKCQHQILMNSFYNSYAWSSQRNMREQQNLLTKTPYDTEKHLIAFLQRMKNSFPALPTYPSISSDFQRVSYNPINSNYPSSILCPSMLLLPNSGLWPPGTLDLQKHYFLMKAVISQAITHSSITK